MLSKFLDIAISDSISKEERRALRLINFALLTTLCANLSLLIVFAIQGKYNLFLMAVCMIFICSGIPYMLMVKRWYRSVRKYIAVYFPPILFGINVVYGDLDISIYYSSIALLIVFLITNKREQHFYIVWTFIWFLAYLLLIKWWRAFEPLVDFQAYITYVHYHVYITGFIINLALIYIIVSDNVRYEKKLERINLQLQAENKNKDKFFSIISHDLRSPYSSFLGLLSMLKNNVDDYSKKEIDEMLQLLHTSAMNSFNLLEELLAWSKSMLSQTKLSFSPVDFEVIVRKCIIQLQSIAQEKHISIHSDLGAENTVCADISSLQTIIRNLISNAIKFTYPHGSIKITSTIVDYMLEVRVSDTGIGMDDETIDQLFDISCVSSQHGTNDEVGSGLGLLLSKEFVEKNGGTIWCTSEKGVGTTFCFTIPLACNVHIKTQQPHKKCIHSHMKDECC